MCCQPIRSRVENSCRVKLILCIYIISYTYIVSYTHHGVSWSLPKRELTNIRSSCWNATCQIHATIIIRCIKRMCNIRVPALLEFGCHGNRLPRVKVINLDGDRFIHPGNYWWRRKMDTTWCDMGWSYSIYIKILINLRNLARAFDNGTCLSFAFGDIETSWRIYTHKLYT